MVDKFYRYLLEKLTTFLDLRAALVPVKVNEIALMKAIKSPPSKFNFNALL